MASEPIEERASVHVRQVRGRYPAEAGRLESNNIEATVDEYGETVRIRLDDSSPGHEDMWLEVVLQVDL